jgi:hypothetical protein
MIDQIISGGQAVLGDATQTIAISGRLTLQPTEPGGRDGGLSPRIRFCPPDFRRDGADLIRGSMACFVMIGVSAVVLSHFLNVMDVLATVYG